MICVDLPQNYSPMRGILELILNRGILFIFSGEKQKHNLQKVTYTAKKIGGKNTKLHYRLSYFWFKIKRSFKIKPFIELIELRSIDLVSR